MKKIKKLIKYSKKEGKKKYMKEINKKNLEERKGFGSFHSEDVETLIRQPEKEFQVPKIYEEISKKSEERVKRILKPYSENINEYYGSKEIKEELFLLGKEYTFINHGAFGANLRIILEESYEWNKYCEEQPLRFYDRELLPLIVNSIREMAKFINCSPVDLYPLQNVTSGLNSIIKSINIEEEEEIMCLSLTYGSTKKILLDKCIESKCKLNIVQIKLPIQSEDTIISRIKEEINEKTRVIILDQITSNTSLEIPIEEISIYCKERNIIGKLFFFKLKN
jgi:isopenicillin-N epimerase